MGFLDPKRNGMLEQLGVKMTERSLDRYLMGRPDLSAPPPLNPTKLPFTLEEARVLRVADPYSMIGVLDG